MNQENRSVLICLIDITRCSIISDDRHVAVVWLTRTDLQHRGVQENLA